MSEEAKTLYEKNNQKDDERMRFVLQIIQPGLAGLMDGTISSLPPFSQRHSLPVIVRQLFLLV